MAGEEEKDDRIGLPRLPLDLETLSVSFDFRRRGAIAQCSSSSDKRDSSNDNRQQRRGGISVERDRNRDYQINFTLGVAKSESAFGEMLTSVERSLLSDIKTAEGQQRHTGRFLTLRKCQRRLWKRLSLTEDAFEQDFLDEVYQKQTTKILSEIDHWNFNTFALDAVTAGRPLPTLLLHLFHHYGLIRTFELDVVKVWKCFAMIEEGYHSKNPYHNAVHATDVTQAMHCFLQESFILNHSSPIELMTSLLAAVTHDLDHPGVNQPFLIATSNHLAALYKNSSVLENHHWRSAVCCLMQSGMLDHFDRSQWDEITFQIRSLILATDITRQNEFLTRLKHYMNEDILDMKDAHYRHFILQIALKCADICNPCRTWEISNRWSRQVCEEFFRQGDVERKLNLPVTALCDRHNTTIAKIQTGFFRFVVAPLFEAWNHLLQTPLSTSLINNLRANQQKWEKMVSDEAENPVSLPTTESSDLPVESAKDPGQLTFDFSNVLMLDPSGRRHSVPVNFPHSSLTQLQSVERLQLAQSLFSTANWATSFSNLIQTRSDAPESRVSEMRAVGVRTLVRQATFPPPLRVPLEAQRPDSDDSEDCRPSCPNNGCGTSSESGEDTEIDEIVGSPQPLMTTTFVGDERRRSLDRDIRLFQLHRKSKPLVRLKSDSDLSRHNGNTNGKVIVGTKVQLAANKEEDEKENAEPGFKTAMQWMRNSYRKIKPQGVSIHCPRLSNRRSSAPVGILQEELFKGLSTNYSEVVEPLPIPKRRDSAPVVLLREQLARAHHHSLDRSNNVFRRGSLPADFLVDTSMLCPPPLQLTADSTVTTATTMSSIITSSSNRLACANDKRNLSFNSRRQSVPCDVSAGAHKRTHVVKLNELLPSSLLCWSNCSEVENGIKHRCCPTSEERANFITKAQSFDTTVEVNGSDGHNSLTNWLKDLPNRRVLFPLHRRSSVPTEAWLFSTSSTPGAGEDQSSDLIVDLN